MRNLQDTLETRNYHLSVLFQFVSAFHALFCKCLYQIKFKQVNV